MLMLTSTRLIVHHQKWNPNRPNIWYATLASLKRYQHLAMFTLEWYINLRSTSPFSLVHSPTSATWADRHGGAAAIRHWKWWRPDLRSFSEGEFHELGTMWWSQTYFYVPYFGKLIPFEEYVDQVGWKHHLDEYPVVNCIVTVDGPDSRVLEPNHF